MKNKEAEDLQTSRHPTTIHTAPPHVLDSYDVYGTQSEVEFDELTTLAYEVLGTAGAYVVIANETSCWIKSGTELPNQEVPRERCFMSNALRTPRHLHEVRDARAHGSYANHVLLQSNFGVVFHAAQPLLTKEGHPLGALCVYDRLPRTLTPAQRQTLLVLSRQVANLLELRRTVTQLTEERGRLSSMNAELERFASVAAHDLRSPLRAMSSFAGLLRRRMRDRTSAEESEMFDHIIGGAARLSAMVEGILNMAKAHHNDYSTTETIDLPTLVGELSDLVDPEQHFEIKFDGSCKRIKASVPAVRQVIMNLMSNAVKYHDKPSGRVIVSSRCEDNQFCLSVSDDGPGIDLDDQERIFEAFETGANAPRVPSTGLGLALVRRVVDRLGGRISLTSSRGAGSRFDVYLPR